LSTHPTELTAPDIDIGTSTTFIGSVTSRKSPSRSGSTATSKPQRPATGSPSAIPADRSADLVADQVNDFLPSTGDNLPYRRTLVAIAFEASTVLNAPP